jgi:hypothetical protein
MDPVVEIFILVQEIATYVEPRLILFKSSIDQGSDIIGKLRISLMRTHKHEYSFALSAKPIYLGFQLG